MSIPKENKRLPLSGVKVIDFSRLIPGPWATQVLSELGADVIKVEQPGIGDPSRQTHPRYRSGSVYFNAVNANKRSIAINMRSGAGQEVAARLCRWADVAVESFRPGVAARLGIDYARVSQINPRLIYCSISGFGQSGALSNIAGHDLAIQALTGAMGCSPDGNAPVPGFQAADFAGALFAVIAIQAALAQRAKTGEGCEVDIAMFEALFSMCFMPLSSELAQMAGYAGEPRLETFGTNPRYSTYRTKDGRMVAVSLLETKAWREFCHEIGRPDLVSPDETPADRLSSHGDQRAMYQEALTRYCSEHTWDELMQQLRRTGVAVCPVASPADAVALTHIEQREMLTTVEHPGDGPIPQFTNPLWRAGLALKQHAPAPELGQHSHQILQFLGYSDSQIDELNREGVVESIRGR
jgi:CoA:oxalate CoA-transferase